MRRPLLLLVTVAAGTGAVASCGKKTDGDDADPRCSEETVTYEGYATDETCVVLLEAEDAGIVQFGGANAPVLLTPTNGASVASATTTLTIAWDTPLDLDTTFATRPPRSRDANRVLHALAKDFAPVSVAWAHEPPVTGAIHLVRVKGVSDGGEPSVATWVTSRQEIVLNGPPLAAVLAAPAGEVAIEVTSIYVEDNRIVNPSTDGPFRPAADTLVTIE